jgi:cysteine desulfurase
MNSENKQTYFDVAATTPLDPEVASLMHNINLSFFGNPSSIHQFGQKAHNILEKSRKKISSILNCHESEIVFTSGGTESNNMVLKSILKRGDHLITSSYEHPAILKVAKNLESKGVLVTYIDPTIEGKINPEDVRKAIQQNTKLISIMYANNEIGSINPIKEIANICNDNNILFHSDAVQCIGKIPIDLSNQKIDFISIAAHKFYGPKSMGILYISRENNIDPLFIGGGQEKGIRPGTENISLIAGMSLALEIATNNMEKNVSHISSMEKTLVEELNKNNINYKINGENRLPGLLNISFYDIEGQTLLMNLDMAGIAISYGSACSSGSSKPSDVLIKIGLDEKIAQNSVRISIGKFIKKDDILNLVDNIKMVIPESSKRIKNIG